MLYNIDRISEECSMIFGKKIDLNKEKLERARVCLKKAEKKAKQAEETLETEKTILELEKATLEQNKQTLRFEEDRLFFSCQNDEVRLAIQNLQRTPLPPKGKVKTK